MIGEDEVAGYVSCMRKMRHAYKLLVVKEGKRSFWKDNIKRDLKDIFFEFVVVGL
jgi:hypothetical protein